MTYFIFSRKDYYTKPQLQPFEWLLAESFALLESIASRDRPQRRLIPAPSTLASRAFLT